MRILVLRSRRLKHHWINTDFTQNCKKAQFMTTLTMSSQVKSSQVKLYCSISGNYAHNESSQKYKQEMNRKTNYISMEIVPLWKLALWTLIACGTKEERYRPVTVPTTKTKVRNSFMWYAHYVFISALSAPTNKRYETLYIDLVHTLHSITFHSTIHVVSTHVANGTPFNRGVERYKYATNL